jgi:hypothetical protein
MGQSDIVPSHNGYIFCDDFIMGTGRLLAGGLEVVIIG